MAVLVAVTGVVEDVAMEVEVDIEADVVQHAFGRRTSAAAPSRAPATVYMKFKNFLIKIYFSL